ncbi:hypothetical protein G6F59_015334 [Rhizopus arrhizus]|nr:hypothetical protein G6F59_015334 [Rhizopus arrhizus]
MGINANAVAVAVFVISSALAAIAGVMIAPIATASVFVGTLLSLKAFSAAILDRRVRADHRRAVFTPGRHPGPRARGEGVNMSKLLIPLVIAALAVGFAPMSAAAAQALPPQSEAAQEWPEVETVRTLLRDDAAAALADCRTPGIGPAGAAPVGAGEPMVRRQDDIRVAAIFGLARRLSADVVVNGELLRYQAGSAAHVEGQVSAGG